MMGNPAREAKLGASEKQYRRLSIWLREESDIVGNDHFFSQASTNTLMVTEDYFIASNHWGFLLLVSDHGALTRTPIISLGTCVIQEMEAW